MDKENSKTSSIHDEEKTNANGKSIPLRLELKILSTPPNNLILGRPKSVRPTTRCQMTKRRSKVEWNRFFFLPDWLEYNCDSWDPSAVVFSAIPAPVHFLWYRRAGYFWPETKKIYDLAFGVIFRDKSCRCRCVCMTVIMFHLGDKWNRYYTEWARITNFFAWFIRYTVNNRN